MKYPFPERKNLKGIYLVFQCDANDLIPTMKGLITISCKDPNGEVYYLGNLDGKRQCLFAKPNEGDEELNLAEAEIVEVHDAVLRFVKYLDNQGLRSFKVEYANDGSAEILVHASENDDFELDCIDASVQIMRTFAHLAYHSVPEEDSECDEHDDEYSED